MVVVEVPFDCGVCWVCGGGAGLCVLCSGAAGGCDASRFAFVNGGGPLPFSGPWSLHAVLWQRRVVRRVGAPMCVPWLVRDASFSLVGPVAEDGVEVIRLFCVDLGSCRLHFLRV